MCCCRERDLLTAFSCGRQGWRALDPLTRVQISPGLPMLPRQTGRFVVPVSGSAPSIRHVASFSAFSVTLDRFSPTRFAVSSTSLVMYKQVDTFLLMVPYRPTWHRARVQYLYVQQQISFEVIVKEVVRWLRKNPLSD